MLIEFSVENFRSIKEKVTLSLIPSSLKGMEKNLINNDIYINKKNKKNLNILNAVAIFGSNAAGKSNVIKAIKYALYCIIKSQSFSPNDVFPYEQFKLDENYLDKPSSFEFKFIKDNIIYNYGFKVLKNKVIEEFLNYKPFGKTIKVFYRNIDEINLCPNKNKLSNEEKIRLKIYEEEISENILILSLANKIKIPALMNAYFWFSHNITYVINRPGIGYKTTGLLVDKKIDMDRFLNLFKFADFTIQDLKLVETNINVDEIPSNFIDGFVTEISRRNNVNIKDIKIKDVQAKKIEEYTKKLGKSKEGKEKYIEFSIYEESDGTQKYYGILGDIIYALKTGSLIIIDELEMRLHTNLSRVIVELFSSSLNEKGAQLIFTTHNTNLLDTKKLLRRDQIYFVEKNDNGYTDLYSLIDFKVRTDKVIQKAYLEGIFGAIPYINLEDLFCI